MPRTWLSISLIAVICVALAASGYFLFRGPDWPLVRDDAHLMNDAQLERITEFHAYLLHDHDIDYRVVTRNADGDMNSAASRMFAQMSAGSRSASGRGLLLVIDPNANLVRLEIGYALEGVFTDAFAAYVENRQMVPFFQKGRIADGILATTELIVARAQDAALNESFETERWSGGSGGAGATAKARLQEGPATDAGPSPSRTIEASVRTPEETLERYRAAMASRDGRPDLAIYTPDTRKMLSDWVITPAQMDNVARSMRSCTNHETVYSADHRHAVIRYPPDERGCPPYFFAITNGAWTLDLVSMQKLVRFGRSNAWRLGQRRGHTYSFAFRDWRFDSHGFPVADN